MTSQEVLNAAAAMDGPSVPQKHDRSSQVAQEMADELHHLNPSDVMGVETNIESQMALAR